jgi:hypothetical protein
MGSARVLRVTDPVHQREQGAWVAKEESHASGFRVEMDGCVPDLTDPATLGCLLALVREAWGDPAAHCEQLFRRISGDWAVFDQSGGLVAKGATEAEALVAALEAAT